MQFVLKGGMPGRYGDKSRLELTGANGGAIKLDYSLLSDEQLSQLEQLIAIATVTAPAWKGCWPSWRSARWTRS